MTNVLDIQAQELQNDALESVKGGMGVFGWIGLGIGAWDAANEFIRGAREAQREWRSKWR